jgi:hypothetical protein
MGSCGDGKMKIRYECNDGYCGKSRPIFMAIDDEDMEGMTPTERDDYIDERVAEHHQENYGYTWSIES